MCELAPHEEGCQRVEADKHAELLTNTEQVVRCVR